MSNKLSILAKSALAIPGMISTVHASGPAESEVSYRYSQYTEDTTPAVRDDSGGSQDRYDISVHQFSILSPVKDKYSVNVEASFESMAGASPVYSYVPEGQDEVYTHFNGASKEQRFDINASGRVYHSLSEMGGGLYFSKERDYLALSSSYDGSIQLNNQMTTLSAGVSFGHDWLNPNSGIADSNGDILMVNDLNDSQLATLQSSNPARYAAKNGKKWQVSFSEGVGQIIDMNTVAQASVTVTYKEGYLSDPYRDCDGIADGVPCDIRPSSRMSGTVSLGVRRFLPKQNGAVHIDYRLFLDTWNVSSHTVDLDYYQNWAPSSNFFTANDIKFQFVPGIRYYKQSKAFFYEIPNVNDVSGAVYTADTTRYYSSDPRLASYGALGLKARFKVDFRQFSLVGGVERYAANPGYGFNFDDDIPGLPSYWRYTAGLDYRY